LNKDTIETEKIEKEINGVLGFPDDRFVGIIREVGFECDRCGKCCTRDSNDHVFLLDEDAERIINIPGKHFLEPAPNYDFCDNLGRFYVLGYAFKYKPDGNCIFYTPGRCERYDIRPAICRIYPYMLHREADVYGKVEWRLIGGLNQHGLYYNKIDNKTCMEIVREVKKYESDFLLQKKRFLHAIKEHFVKHALKHSRQMYDRKMRDYENGEKIEVHVFFKGTLIKEKVSKQVINPE
jgi:Fe-S-cluster containining protein